MKALSLKLDDDIASALDLECYLCGQKRNRYINIAVRKQLQRDDEARRRACGIPMGMASPLIRDEDGLKYILLHLTDENKRFLQQIHAQMGMDTFRAISLGLLLLQKDYNRRPFDYLPTE